MFYNCTHSGSRMLFLLIVSAWTDMQQKPISPLAEKISPQISCLLEEFMVIFLQAKRQAGLNYSIDT